MARQEQDREDLLREATALVERVELRCEGFAEPVVIGFRRSGEGSIFIGADPVFQFNAHQDLRRGYYEGRLLKAEKGILISLERRRTATEVELRRSELTAEDTDKFMTLLHAQLSALRQVVRAHRLTIVGQVPADADVVGRVARWLDSIPEPVAIATAPNVR